MRERRFYRGWSEKAVTGRRQSWEVALAEGAAKAKALRRTGMACPRVMRDVCMAEV